MRTAGGDSFKTRLGKLPSIVPANFSEKQFGVAENTGQWIVEFVVQNFVEIFVKASETINQRINFYISLLVAVSKWNFAEGQFRPF